MSEQTLTIDLDEEYKIKIESPEQFQESFFKSVYEKAALATTDIVEQSKANTENTKKHSNLNNIFLKESQEYNNIVAFTGDRGTGKTSAMISFAQFLIKNDADKKEAGIKDIEKLYKSNFISIPTIDPSLFEEGENILEVTLAHMFAQFESHLNTKNEQIDINGKRKLLECFEKVYDNLQTIKKGSSNYDGEAIETLSKLACSTKLRENFKELISKYIQLVTGIINDEESSYENNRKEKCAYLIIPIDDFDLNVKGAVEMSEQIRKYFMIPNVIILMSVNMSQLKDAKELSIRKEFKDILESMTESPSKMTVQYLLKLIPNNRRLQMPQLDKNTKISIPVFNNLFDIEESIDEVTYKLINYYTGLIFMPYNNDITYDSNLSKQNKENNNIENTQQTKYQLKTPERIAYKNNISNKYVHYNIITYNIREYRELILFILKNMNKPTDNNEKLRNLIEFESYFKFHIIKNTIKNDDTRNKILDILKCTDKQINKFTINIIYNEFNREVNSTNSNTQNTKLINNDSYLNKTINQNTNSTNISLADVLYFANKYAQYFNNIEKDTFIDAIKIIYSIKLLKLILNKSYDEAQIIFGDKILSKEIEEQLITPDIIHGLSHQEFPIQLNIDDFQNIEDYLPLLLFTPFWGSIKSFKNKRNDSEIYYRRNTNDKTSTWFNIFSFLPLQFSVLSTTNRLKSYVRDENKIEDRKYLIKCKREITEYLNNNALNIPIYSIDFIENKLESFYTTNQIKSKEKYEICCETINQIETRINRFLRYYHQTNENGERIYIDFADHILINNFLGNNAIENNINNLDYELSTISILKTLKEVNHTINYIDEIISKPEKNAQVSYSLIRERCIELEKGIPDTTPYELFKLKLSIAFEDYDILRIKKTLKDFSKKLILSYEGKLSLFEFDSHIEDSTTEINS